ncbi:MAG: hypothetical protein ABMA14_16265 [Hyphomonadaceae bacterium]
MHRSLFFLCTAVLSLTACGEPATQKVEIEPAVPGPYVETTARPGPSTPEGSPAAPSAAETLPSSQTTPGPIPTAFRHVWAIEKKDCTAEPALTRIAIAPGAVRFYEGRAVVVSANTSLEGTVAMEVDHTSEGATTREAHTLALNPAKTALTYDRNGEAFNYVRCD